MKTTTKMEKKNKPTDGAIEKRVITVGAALERRSDDGASRKVSGYAAVFNQFTKIGHYFEERIAPGAFDGCNFDRCVLNFNHDNSQLLARTSSETLRLKVDEKGLYFEADLPDTTLAGDILKLIERGDITGCSFAFVVRASEWKWISDEDPSKLDQRTITEISEVYDVSVVTHPAYEQTSVDARSAELARQEHLEQLAERDRATFERECRERELQFIKTR